MTWECCSRRRSRLSSGNVVRGEAAKAGLWWGLGQRRRRSVGLPLCFCGIWGGVNMRPGPLERRLSTQHPDQARWWPDQARTMARRRAISTRLAWLGAWANEILFCFVGGAGRSNVYETLGLRNCTFLSLLLIPLKPILLLHTSTGSRQGSMASKRGGAVSLSDLMRKKVR